MTYFSRIVLIAVLLCGVAFAQQSYNAIDFNYPALIVETGNTATGSQTIYLRSGYAVTPGGITFQPITTNTPLKIGSGATTDSVTPSAVTCTTPRVAGTCAITATFTYTHGRGERVSSATYGLQEAANYAASVGGGAITTDAKWTRAGGTAQMLAAVVYPSAANVTVANGASGYFARSAALPAAAGTVRVIQGSVSTSASTFTGTNIVGVRGDATVSATTNASAGYIYGVQGKLIVPGTLSGNGWNFGVVGQLDISTATLTAGSHVGAIWADAGTSGPNASVAFADLIVGTNTTATTFNSLVYLYGKASFLMDLSNNGSAFIDAAAHGSTAAGRLAVKINGATRYLYLFSD